MDLEDKALTVRLVTFDRVEGNDEKGYKIFIKEDSKNGILIKADIKGRNLVKRLFPGDKLFKFVDEKNAFVGIYGYVEDDKLYIY